MTAPKQVHRKRREKIQGLRESSERMSPRERAIKAMAHEEADRIPIDLWVTTETQQRMTDYWGFSTWEDCLQFLGVDFRYWRGSSYAGHESRARSDGSVEDHWGVPRRVVEVGEGRPWRTSYREAVQAPLASARTLDEIHEYDRWPSADQWDYDNAAAEVRAIRQRSGDVFIWNGGDRFDRAAHLKPMMYVRGIQETFTDLALRPEIVVAIVGHIHEYFMDYNRRTYEATHGLVDGFFCGDDMGTQRGPMMSVRMYRRYFKRKFSEYVSLAHDFHLPVMYHTCGSVRTLIPEFLDCKLDILQSLQPQAKDMDLCSLKEQFGEMLAFQGGGDIQQIRSQLTGELGGAVCVQMIDISEVPILKIHLVLVVKPDETILSLELGHPPAVFGVIFPPRRRDSQKLIPEGHVDHGHEQPTFIRDLQDAGEGLAGRSTKLELLHNRLIRMPR